MTGSVRRRQHAGQAGATASPRLELRGLSVTYRRAGGRPSEGLQAVRGVDLRVAAGEAVGIVGESGCGKTSLARAIGGMLSAEAVIGGQLLIEGTDLAAATASDWAVRQGRTVVMVPQGGMSALDPVRTIGAQLLEQLCIVGGRDRGVAQGEAAGLLEQVDLHRLLLPRYPHELSGGMRQRVALALAIAAGPDLVVADEPTTGLDTDVGYQVLDLLIALCRDRGLALVVVSHDLAPLAVRCDRIAVMYAGQIVEERSAAAVTDGARHPYSRALVRAVPDADPFTPWLGIPGRPPDLRAPPPGCAFASRCPIVVERCRVEDPVGMLGDAVPRVACHRAAEGLPLPLTTVSARRRVVDGVPVLAASGIHVVFRSRQGQTVACDGADLTVRAGEVVALLGPSGSGKTTLARVALGLLRPDAGEVLLGGADLSRLRGRELRQARRRAGFVHQDVYGALHPAMTVRQLLSEPLGLAGVARSMRDGRIRDALSRAGLTVDQALLSALPHRLSGGQRQRVALARAVVGDPLLIVADEPTSMLDAALRAEIALLLRGLADDAGRGVLLITHDRGEAAKLADTLVILRDGAVVATGPPEAVSR